jgi:hypothetical protein
MTRFDYWIPALVRRAKPGSLGRNDRRGCCGATRSPVVGAKCDSPTWKGGGAMESLPRCLSSDPPELR